MIFINIIKLTIKTVIPSAFSLNRNLNKQLFINAKHKDIMTIYFNNSKLTPKLKVLGLLNPNDLLFQESLSTSQMPFVLVLFLIIMLLKNLLILNIFLNTNFSPYQQNILEFNC